MKTRSVLTLSLALAALLGGHANAESAGSAESAQPAPAAQPAQPAEAPLLGLWAVDTARLPMAPQVRPRSVLLRFSSPAPGRLGLTVDVVTPDGGTLHAEGVTPLDGTATAVPANFEADMSATTTPASGVLVMQLAKGGVPASTRIYTVAADGRTMTETVAHFGPDGRPVLRQNHFTRQP